MNSLSWLLYLADVFGSVNSTAGILVFVSGFVALVSAFAYLPLIDCDADDGAFSVNRKILKTAIVVFLSMLCVKAICPSENTVYAIAASEMGEKALATPTATKAMKALDHWLDKQIDDKPQDKN